MARSPSHRPSPQDPAAQKRWQIKFAPEDNSIFCVLLSVFSGIMIGVGALFASARGAPPALEFGVGFGSLIIGVGGTVYVLATSRAGNWMGAIVLGVIIQLTFMNMGVFRAGEVGGILIELFKQGSVLVSPVVADTVIVGGLFGLIALLAFPTG